MDDVELLGTTTPPPPSLPSTEDIFTTTKEKLVFGHFLPLLDLRDMSIRVMNTEDGHIIPNARIENGYLQFENGTSISVRNVISPGGLTSEAIVSVDLLSGTTSLVDLSTGEEIMSRSSTEGIPIDVLRNHSQGAMFEILLDNAIIQVDTYNGQWTVQNAETGAVELVQEVKDGVLYLANGEQVRMPTTGLENEVIAIDTVKGVVQIVNKNTGEVGPSFIQPDTMTTPPEENETDLSSVNENDESEIEGIPITTDQVDDDVSRTPEEIELPSTAEEVRSDEVITIPPETTSQFSTTDGAVSVTDGEVTTAQPSENIQLSSGEETGYVMEVDGGDLDRRNEGEQSTTHENPMITSSEKVITSTEEYVDIPSTEEDSIQKTNDVDISQPSVDEGQPSTDAGDNVISTSWVDAIQDHITTDNLGKENDVLTSSESFEDSGEDPEDSSGMPEGDILHTTVVEDLGVIPKEEGTTTPSGDVVIPAVPPTDLVEISECPATELPPGNVTVPLGSVDEHPRSLEEPYTKVEDEAIRSNLIIEESTFTTPLDKYMEYPGSGTTLPYLEGNSAISESEKELEKENYEDPPTGVIKENSTDNIGSASVSDNEESMKYPNAETSTEWNTPRALTEPAESVTTPYKQLIYILSRSGRYRMKAHSWTKALTYNCFYLICRMQEACAISFDRVHCVT